MLAAGELALLTDAPTCDEAALDAAPPNALPPAHPAKPNAAAPPASTPNSMNLLRVMIEAAAFLLSP